METTSTPRAAAALRRSAAQRGGIRTRQAIGFAFLLALAVGLMGLPRSVGATPIASADLLAFDQHPGARLPAGTVLKDEAGLPVALGALLESRPTILAFDYLRCPNLCGLVLGGLLDGLTAAAMDNGSYRVLAISIDPSEGPTEAAAARKDYEDRFGAATLRGWTFLTGTEEGVRHLADAAGFPYRFDPALGQFAHPAGLVILTPQGVIARYLLGVTFPPADLRRALAEAGAGTISAPAARLLLLCYDYDAASGSYTPSIMKLVRWGGALTVVLGGLLLAAQLRRETRG